MSRLLPKAANDFSDVPFNKEKIIQEIKEMLPNPWSWYTLNDCMEEYDNPKYDLVLIRHKEVTEQEDFSRPFTSVKNIVQSVYSIVIGVYVVDKFSSQKTFDTTEEFSTAAVEVKSSLMLFDIVKSINAQVGGIKNGS